jgi:hypothetical protein
MLLRGLVYLRVKTTCILEDSLYLSIIATVLSLSSCHHDPLLLLLLCIHIVLRGVSLFLSRLGPTYTL